MSVRVQDITEQIRRQIESFEAPVQQMDVGQIEEVGDGIARVTGLSKAMAGELVEFPKTGVLGLALNLEETHVGIIIMGEYQNLEEGDLVRSTGRIGSVPVG